MRSRFDPEEVRRLYWDDHLSTTAVAKQLGFGGGAPAVIRFMQRHAIPRRSVGEGVSISWEGNEERRVKAGENIGLQAVIHYAKGVVTRAAQYRSQPTAWESIAMAHFDARGEAYQFQVPFDIYIADFVFPARRLIIEIDSQHHRIRHIAERDQRRTEYLESLGYRVGRIEGRQERSIATFKRQLDALLL